ncbi:type II toxin-antitoxin system VapC family toxin [bacterium]|nr:type II toxin-antitoxin system VapC family toxin [bacterium]
MKLLLDTCTFLWLAEGDPRLSALSLNLFQDPANQAFLSAASAWEISLKHALGKLPLAESPQVYIPHMRHLHQIESLPVTEDDSIRAGRLPLLHRDPFDRLLVGQAIGQGCVLLTPDPLIEQYSVPVLW